MSFPYPSESLQYGSVKNPAAGVFLKVRTENPGAQASDLLVQGAGVLITRPSPQVGQGAFDANQYLLRVDPTLVSNVLTVPSASVVMTTTNIAASNLPTYTVVFYKVNPNLLVAAVPAIPFNASVTSTATVPIVYTGVLPLDFVSANTASNNTGSTATTLLTTGAGVALVSITTGTSTAVSMTLSNATGTGAPAFGIANYSLGATAVSVAQH